MVVYGKTLGAASLSCAVNITIKLHVPRSEKEESVPETLSVPVPRRRRLHSFAARKNSVVGTSSRHRTM